MWWPVVFTASSSTLAAIKWLALPSWLHFGGGGGGGGGYKLTKMNFENKYKIKVKKV